MNPDLKSEDNFAVIYAPPAVSLDTKPDFEFDQTAIWLYEGRFGRAQFIFWSTVSVILLVGLIIAFGSMLNLARQWGDLGSIGTVLLGLCGIAVFLLNFVFVMRRLHDMNRSGALVFATLIPAIGGFILLALLLFCLLGRGSIGVNNYGAPRQLRDWERYGAWVIGVVWAIWFTWLLFGATI